MKVFISVPRGFCAGVVRAIDVVELLLKQLGPPIYIKHQIVHNPYVVKALENKGAITVENVDEIPDNSTVVFSAHGSPPEDFKKSVSKNLHVIDATCPLVTKVHNEAHKYSKEGRNLILVGHRGHQEVKGTMGQATVYLVSDKGETKLPNWKKDTPVAVLTQTTLSVDDTAHAIDKITQKFSNVVVRNDLCYATTNRQFAVKELCNWVNFILVIGSPNSSNCSRLREVAEKNGATAYLINSPDDINHNWLEGVQHVGITSGASTPEQLVDSVIEKLNPTEVIPIIEAEENVNFVLPKELRQ